MSLPAFVKEPLGKKAPARETGCKLATEKYHDVGRSFYRRNGLMRAIQGSPIFWPNSQTMLWAESVLADLQSFVDQRRLDNSVHLPLRVGGARELLWLSEVPPGHQNDLALRVHGLAA